MLNFHEIRGKYMPNFHENQGVISLNLHEIKGKYMPNFHEIDGIIVVSTAEFHLPTLFRQTL